MNENPYESRQAAVASTAPDDIPAGLWRDREQLVMRIHDRTSPRRCVKTNETFNGAATRLDVDWIPNHGMWLLLLGALGHAIAKSMYGKTISVEIPVSQQWLLKRKGTANIGGAMTSAEYAVSCLARLVTFSRWRLEWMTVHPNGSSSLRLRHRWSQSLA